MILRNNQNLKNAAIHALGHVLHHRTSDTLADSPNCVEMKVVYQTGSPVCQRIADILFSEDYRAAAAAAFSDGCHGKAI